MHETDLVSAVQAGAHLSSADEARRAVRATLETLGTRLYGGEPADLAAQLPKQLAEVLPINGPGERFGVEEFYERVAAAERLQVRVARQHARAVAAALKAAISPGELNDVLAQLSPDYNDLFEVTGPVH